MSDANRYPDRVYRFSAKQELEIVACYARGEKVSIILEKFKIPQTTFRGIRDRYDVPLRPAGRPRKVSSR